MELRQVEYFLAVARHTHFTAAADEVGVAQPALSQQIKRLEEELGVRLFNRTSRHVRLTEAGEAFRDRAQRILAEAESAKDEMRQFAELTRGRVLVGALQSLAALWLPKLLSGFHELHPGIEIVLREEDTPELAHLLTTGDLDVAFLHEVPGLYPGNGAPAGIVLEPLFVEELVVIVPPDHSLARRQRVALSELRDLRFVLLGRRSGLWHTIMEETAAEGFAPDVAFESGDMATVPALVAAGLGVSILPSLAAEAAVPAVTIVRLDPPIPSHTTALASLENRCHPAATTAFLEFVRDYVAMSSEPDASHQRQNPSVD